jgi:hypothetical protein
MTSSVVKFQIPTGQALSRQRMFTATRLELDISTDAEKLDPVPGKQLPVLFDELVGLGLEISVEGDVP